MALTKLTPEVEQAICQAILAGNGLEVAAEYVGIASRTIRRWRARGQKAKSGPFVRFVRAIKKAQAQAEVRNVALIQEAGARTWQAAAWFLERRHPQRWGLKGRRALNRLSEEVRALRQAINQRAQERAG
jgi:hypothetical protein